MGVVDGKPESYGKKYSWYSLFDENDQISNFPWGDNWRIPTNEEFEFLLEHCTIVWTTINDVPGIIITGIGEYSNNSIFLPACDYDEDTNNTKYYHGRYWSSTSKSLENAYWFNFYENQRYPNKISFNGKHRYMSIRPVLAENINKDDKSYVSEQQFIGTWDGSITSDGVTFEASIVIKADGTYFETSGHGFNSFSGNWKDNGNGTVTLTNFFDPTFKYTLTRDRLVLTGNNWNAIFSRRYN